MPPRNISVHRSVGAALASDPDTPAPPVTSWLVGCGDGAGGVRVLGAMRVADGSGLVEDAGAGFWGVFFGV